MEDNRLRLQKFLADSGMCSRRKAEEHIENEDVTVNGKIATIGQKVDPKRDHVELLGKKVDTTFRKRDEKVYILLNKPCGYVTTMKDEKDRKTVVDLVKIDRRIVPVGRLDINTSGAILLSNDGDFIYELTHPKHEIKKTYTAIVKGLITYEAIDMLEKGVQIEDGLTKPAKVDVMYVDEKSDTSKIEIQIHEGKNRQVRKMCDAVGHEVKKLDRRLIGDLGIKNLGLGKWRYLTKKEIEGLGYEKAVVRTERTKQGQAYREDRAPRTPFNKDDRLKSSFKKDDKAGRTPFNRENRSSSNFKKDDRRKNTFKKDDRKKSNFKKNEANKSNFKQEGIKKNNFEKFDNRNKGVNKYGKR